METFGLGLILSFTDNASSGMMRAAGNLARLEGMASTVGGSMMTLEQQMNHLAIAGANLTIVGDQVTNVGAFMLGGLTKLMAGVKDTGAEFESFRITLNALYNDEQEVSKQMNNLLNFSATTPFEVADTKDLLVTLKSQGIEAFDEMTGASTGLRQANLAWIGDLMTFKPEVPISRWKLALQNFIGSGEQKVLRNILDMGNISDILGRDIGSTPLDRFKDLIEVIEKKNLQGLMGKNMGTFNQMLSNVADQFTMLRLEIGDTVVGTRELTDEVTGLKRTVDVTLFDELKQSLKGLTSVMLSIDEVAGEGTFKKFTKSLAEGLHSISKPLISLSDNIGKLIGNLIVFIGNHPNLTKMMMAFTAMSGAGLLAFGVLLKFSGSIYMLTAGLRNLTFLFPSLGKGFTIFSSMLNGIIFKSIVPFALVSAIVYEAWHRNMLGIQTAVIDASSVIGLCLRALVASWDGVMTLDEFNWVKAAGLLNFVSAVQSAKHALTELVKGIEEGFMGALNMIAQYIPSIDSFGRTLKDLIDKVSLFVAEITGYQYKDDYRQLGIAIGMIAVALGIVIPAIKLFGVVMAIAQLPFIPFIAVVGALVAGFLYLRDNMTDASGQLTSVGSAINKVLSSIGSSLDKIFLKNGSTAFRDMFSGLTDSIQTLDFSPLKDKITSALANLDFSKILGGAVIGLTAIFKPDIFTKMFSGMGKALAPVSKPLGNVAKEAGIFFINVFKTFLTRGIPQIGTTLLGGFKVIFGGIASKLGPFILPVLSSVGGAFASLGSNILMILASVGGVFAGFGELIWTGISPYLMKVGLLFKGVFSKITPILSKIAAPIVNTLSKLWTSVSPYLTRIFGSIGSLLSKAFSSVSTLAKPLLGALGSLFSSIAGAIGPLLGSILSAVLGPAAIVGAIIAALSVGVSMLGDTPEDAKSNVKNFFSGLWDKVPDTIKEPLLKAFEFVKGFVDEIGKKMGLEDGWNSLVTWCDNIFTKMWELGDLIKNVIIGPLIDWVTEAWNGWLGDLVGNIMGFVGRVVELFMALLPYITIAIGAIMDIVLPIVDFLGEIINGIIEVINGIIDFLIGVFTGDWDKAWEGIKEIFSGIWDAFKPIVEAVINAIIKGINKFIDGIVNGILGVINWISEGIAKGLDSILDYLGVDFEVPSINLEVPTIPEVKLNTGGYIKDEGMAYLHPNEVVVNDPLTRSLRTFLDRYNSPEATSITNIDNSSVSYSNVSSSVPTIPNIRSGSSSSSSSTYDNSVTFSQGSIVIQVQNANSQSEIEAMASKIMQIIERKQALRAMAIRG